MDNKVISETSLDVVSFTNSFPLALAYDGCDRIKFVPTRKPLFPSLSTQLAERFLNTLLPQEHDFRIPIRRWDPFVHFSRFGFYSQLLATSMFSATIMHFINGDSHLAFNLIAAIIPVGLSVALTELGHSDDGLYVARDAALVNRKPVASISAGFRMMTHEAIHSLGKQGVIGWNTHWYMATAIDLFQAMTFNLEMEVEGREVDPEHFQAGRRYFQTREHHEWLDQIGTGTLFQKEPYHLGVFIAGILAQMKDQRISLRQQIDFLRQLLAGKTIQESIAQL